MAEANERSRALLIAEARTLRERVFVRCLTWVKREPGPPSFRRVDVLVPGAAATYILPAGDLSLESLMAEARPTATLGWIFTQLPILSPTKVHDPELAPHLQDLADLVAYEASEALRASFYPRPADVEPLTDDHVRQVMVALTREYKREARRRQATFLPLTQLPWERQVALAERRRLWFRRFGITADAWRRGHFSLWDVADDPLPDHCFASDEWRIGLTGLATSEW